MLDEREWQTHLATAMLKTKARIVQKNAEIDKPFYSRCQVFQGIQIKKPKHGASVFSVYRRIIFLQKHVQSRNRPFRPYVEILSDRAGQEEPLRRPGMPGYRKAWHGQFPG